MTEDEELLAELGVEVSQRPAKNRTPREERIIAGFEDILRFHQEHGRAPQHGENRDIFERLYAVRLDRLRELKECHELLAIIDTVGLLASNVEASGLCAELDDDALLAELGVAAAENDLTKLKHVRSSEERRAAEEIANRTVCKDYPKFKPLIDQVRKDLAEGIRETRPFQKMAEIKQGEFFIVGGQIAYVAEVTTEFVTEYDRRDGRLRVVYDNGTESDLLVRSLQRALHRDEAGRRITDPTAGPLFGSHREEGDLESGTIYVLRSKSDNPLVAANRDVIHKIGVTGDEVVRRISSAAQQATYLLADVEVVATYRLYQINRSKIERLIHKVLSRAKLDITIKDRFGQPVRPQEWFLVPLPIIDQIVERITDGSIADFVYEPESAALKRLP